MNNYNDYILYQALDIAKSVKGYTSPNPSVGAIIVKNNKIISKGGTQTYGNYHAEIDAINNSPCTENTSLYTTLEPCCHKNISCVNQIIKAKINKVYFISNDINPKVYKKSTKILNSHNIQVIQTQNKELIQSENTLNEDFRKFIIKKRPYITLKYAMSLNGNMIPPSKDKYITSHLSLTEVHRLRHINDAIMVGVNTIIKDNPNLTNRLYIPNPYNKLKYKDYKKVIKRIILDPNLRIPINSQVIQDNNPTILVIKSYNLKSNKYLTIKSIFNKKNYKHIILDNYKDSYLNIDNLLFSLVCKFNIISILVEGGPTTIEHLIRNEYIDKVICFIAPKIIFNKSNDAIITKLDKPRYQYSYNYVVNKLKNTSVNFLNNDIMITGYYYNADFKKS